MGFRAAAAALKAWICRETEVDEARSGVKRAGVGMVVIPEEPVVVA